MTVVDLKPAHFASLLAQDVTGRFANWEQKGIFEQAESSIKSTAVINNLGQPVAIGGIIEYWPGRAEIWGLISTSTHAEFIVTHRAAQKLVNSYWGRLECIVNYDFTEGHRWAKQLGFEVETAKMPNYFENGNSATMWVKFGMRGSN